MSKRIAGPSGMHPPAKVTSPHGVEIDLLALAQQTAAVYDAEFPDERTRYGPAGMDWCVHDNQHLLNWAFLSLTVGVDFEAELAWLGSVLEARKFPIDRLARDLEMLAEIVEAAHPQETEVVQRIREGAVFVASRPTFLT
jgi:hypothetical protein